MAARRYITTGSSASFDDTLIDTKLICPMRFVLAATALLIIYIDPSQPDRLVLLTYTLLISYTAYSGLLLFLSFAAPRLLPVNLLHWLDLTWYIALISVSSGTNSIFFLLLFFPILVASFRCGFASGLTMTVIATTLFVIVGYLTAPTGADFELNRFLLRAVTLLGLGYMIAHWGGSEIELKRRLQLLKDVTNLSNPRFGAGRTISLGLERLRSFYKADASILVYRLDNNDGYKLIRVDHRKAEPALPEEITDELAAFLMAPQSGVAVMRVTGTSNVLFYDIFSGRVWHDTAENAQAIGTTLGAKSFGSVPVEYRGKPIGRLYIVGGRKLNQSDIEFLLQVIEHVSPLLENIGLLDRLASEAAEQERKKLARDIHDSVIQPYVGLQFGLAAVRQKLLAENSSAFGDVNELCEVANEEVRGLRRYLDELKAVEAHFGILLPAVRRFAEKYTAATGISVEIVGNENLQLNDRLSAEVFQLITEGLSNIRRHTMAQMAFVEIRCEQDELLLKISNEISNGSGPQLFTPVSITERAVALGGCADVLIGNKNTTVAVRIPL